MNERVFERAFAEAGQKAVITDKEYRGGWFDVVGGINGIPTSQQFNMIMNFQEEKVNYLYRLLKEIDIAALFNLDDIQKAFDEIFCFRYIVYQNIIEALYHQTYTHEPEYITTDTGRTWADYGTEMSPQEIKDAVCAGWDGADTEYYDNCAVITEEEYCIVFGKFTDSDAITPSQILEAISTPWNGQSSADPTAMSAEEVEEAVNTPWNGQSSADPTAMSAVDVRNAVRNAAL